MPAVLFDLDGVLIDSMRRHAAAWVEAGNGLGIKIDPSFIYREEGRPSEKIAWTLVTGTKVSPNELLESKRCIFTRERLRTGKDDELFDGAEALLVDLDGRGCTLGLVSSAPRSRFIQGIPRKLRDLFSLSVTDDDVPGGKVGPEPYRKAVAALGEAFKGSTFVIENAPLGIRSAKLAGLPVVGVLTTCPGDDLYDAGADYVCPNLARVGELLLKLTIR